MLKMSGKESDQIQESGTLLSTPVADMAGGIIFVDSDTGTLSGVKISDVMSNMDGLSRRDRVRYDTPAFAGFTISGSLTEESKQDVGIVYSGKTDTNQFAVAAGYAHQDTGSTEHQYNGSASLIIDNKFNISLAGGMRQLDSATREEPYFAYGKLGYKANITSFGSTNFAIDYGYFKHISQDDDDAQTVGLFAVQNVDSVGVDIYAGYRWHELDRTGTDFDDINAFLFGSRVKF